MLVVLILPWFYFTVVLFSDTESYIPTSSHTKLGVTEDVEGFSNTVSNLIILLCVSKTQKKKKKEKTRTLIPIKSPVY